jgi:hypothetical protein
MRDLVSGTQGFSRLRFEVYSSDLAQALLELGLDIERRSEMAIELKGLRAKALAARSHLDKINAAYDKFNAAAPAHADEVAKMATDLGEMQSDLEFATGLLGNSAEGSEKLDDHVKPGPFPSYPTTLKVAGS